MWKKGGDERSCNFVEATTRRCIHGFICNLCILSNRQRRAKALRDDGVAGDDEKFLKVLARICPYAKWLQG